MKQRTQNIIVLGCLYGIIFSLVYMSPLGMDDYIYAIQQNTMLEAFRMELHQYLTWTGRSIAHLSLRFFLLLPRIVTILLMPAVFIAILLYTLAMIHGPGWREKTTIYQIFLLFTAFWFLVPKFGSVFFYMASFANYALMLLLAFVFLYPYRALWEKKSTTDRHRFVTVLGMFLLGILAGWTNENTGLMVIFFSLIIIGYLLYQKQKPPLWAYSGAFASIVGFLFLALAPGNYVRMANPDFAHWAAGSIGYKFYIFFSRNIHINQILIFLLVFLVLLLWWKKREWLDVTKPYVQNSLLFLFVAAIGAFSLVAAPFQPNRILLSVTVFLFISIFSVVFYRFPHNQKVALLAIGITCISVGYNLFLFIENYQIQKERMQILEKAHNEKDIVWPPFKHSNTYFFIGNDSDDIKEDPTYFINTFASKYYHVRSMRVESEKKP